MHLGLILDIVVSSPVLCCLLANTMILGSDDPEKGNPAGRQGRKAVGLARQPGCLDKGVLSRVSCAVGILERSSSYRGASCVWRPRNAC